MKAILSCIFICLALYGQTQVYLSGNLFNSENKKPVPFARLYFKNFHYAAISNLEGEFSLPKPNRTDTLEIECVGYQPLSIIVKPEHADSIDIFLKPNTTLREIEVFAKKRNPAFRILKAVRENEKINNPDQLKSYEYEVYNTVQLDLTNLSPRFYDNPLFGNLDFVTGYMDTIDGTHTLPAIFTESVSNFYFHRLPEQRKEVISATRVTGFKNLRLESYTGQTYQNFNIYDNFIDIFNTDFMSPLAIGGRAFYEYKLIGRDTVDGIPCYHLSFIPKRKGDPVFEGNIWITAKEYAIKQVEAGIPEMVNINFVSGFKINQKLYSV